jgi:hypothetical protein
MEAIVSGCKEGGRLGCPRMEENIEKKGGISKKKKIYDPGD